MPRVHLVQTNMTAGELSPDMYGRTDIDRYPNAVKEMTNAFATVQGGAKGREGTVFVASAKSTATNARLVPFVFNRTQSYILEFGENYMRVFRDHAQIESSPGVPYEIATPYDATEIMEMDYAQRSDTMFITHQDFPVYRLRRFADDSWDISPAPWVYEPTAELGFRPTASLTLSSAAVGTGRTFIASAGEFVASDVGRDITSNAGLATITGYTSTTEVTATIVTAFLSTSIASAAWKIEGSPQTTITPSAVGPVGTAITLTLGADGWRNDLPAFVPVNGGLAEITGYVSTTIANAKVLRELDSTTAAPALAWSIQTSMWGGDNRYPATCTFYQQRLVMAGSPGFPRHVFGSAIGNSFDFLLGTDDADAFATPLADSDEIRYLASVRALSAMSFNGEFVLEGGVEKAMAPTNIQITNQSNYGTDRVRPVRIGNELYFVQRAGQKLRAFTYRFSEDSFDAPDMTKLANHIAGPGFTELSYQQEPYSRLFALRQDGVLAVATLDRTEGVVAWARWITYLGNYKSVATIPVGDKDETWVLVRRTAGGNPQMYIEYFDAETHTDCCLQDSSVGPVTTWSGLDHLEGLTVAVLADNVVMPNETVTGGEITLPRGAVEVEIGIPYEPYIELLPVEFPTGSGTAQGAQGRTGEVIVRLKNTIGCTIGNPESPDDAEVLAFRRFGVDVLDEPVPLFSGDKKINKLGWEQNTGSVFISQPQPLPLHVLSVIRRVTVND